jgi:tetratricopeptide (TPR) repeat protein
MPNKQAPAEVFYSYAHKDEMLRNELEQHLKLLQRQGLIISWHDRQILPGTDWAQAIDTHLKTASLILLLISSDFLASDYCYGIEMQRALERNLAKEAQVIPILLRPVDNWQSTPFGHLQVLPTGALPVTKWADRDSAFTDIAQGIRRALQNMQPHPAVPPSLAFLSIWNIPYPRNPVFTGREEILQRIHTQLQAGQSMALSQAQAISGLGGIGKTQIAIEYAYQYRQDYQTVLWTLADTRESLISGYLAIAKKLQLPEKDTQDQPIVIEAVKNWLQTHDSWLLILDNADDLSMAREFIPPTFDGHLLLTTRAWNMGRLAKRIEVETMGQDAGALFLLRRVGLVAETASLDTASSTDRATARSICEELGGLPLALDQAGAFIEESQSSLADYLHIYRARRSELLSERGGLIDDHREGVSTTWSLSFKKVEEKNPAAADLLRILAFVHPEAIPEEIITQGSSHLGSGLQKVARDPLLLSQAIAALLAYSLVRRDPEAKTLSIHRLVQAVLRDAMDDKTRKQWAERAVRSVNAVFPEVEFKTWPECERYLPHALSCAERVEQEQISSLEAARLLYEAGCYLIERARVSEASPLLQQALVMREQYLGYEHIDTANTVDRLARCFEMQGKYAEAEPLYRRALGITEQQLGSEHPETAASLNNLALLYYERGKYEEAEPMYKRALSIREQKLGEMHPDTAQSLNNLAALYRAQGKYEEAEPLYKRACSIYEQKLGEMHPWTATSLHNLAALYDNRGKYEEAEPLFKRVLLIREQTLGPSHPGTQSTREWYISLLRKMGRDEEATTLETQDQMPSEEH